MERALAQRMLSAPESLNPGLDEATRITQAMTDPEEARMIRRHLGDILAKPLYEIVRHIVRQYPDLDPERPGDSRDPGP